MRPGPTHRYPTFRSLRRPFAIACSLLSVVALRAADKGREPNDFLSLSMEELGAIKITSVSKKSERLDSVPAAVSVITGDDIHGSNAMTLPDLLRMAPGASVAKVDASHWAVTLRGFNDTYAQKLLVLMDGRSIYTPLFSGTIWHAQDTMLEDVDRIEVIRGPGGTVWGANAVNGVISIVSKPSRETQGLLLSGGSGSEHTAIAGARYGAQLGTNTFVRIYGKHDEWSDSRLAGGGTAYDAWGKSQGGFRLDWEPASTDRLTLQGDIFALWQQGPDSRITLPVLGVPPPPAGYNPIVNSVDHESGGNVLGRWSHQFSSDSDLSVQTYYDRERMTWPILGQTRNTFDIDLRQRFQWGPRHEIVWGGGYRVTDSKLKDSFEITMQRKTRSDQIFNGFVQDEIALLPDRLRWTLGTKVEHNDYTGLEVQPGTRLSWTLNSKQTVWASAARAVRTPAQIEHDGHLNLAVLPPSATLPLPTLVSAEGSPDFKSETLTAYEVGYRIQPCRPLTFDAAAFFNDYAHLRGSDDHLDLSAAPAYAQVHSIANNDVHGHTYGAELSTTWQAADWWRLHGQISFIRSQLHQPPNSLTGAARTPGIATPEHQVSVRSSMNLGRHLTLDVFARFVDRIPNAGVAVPGLPNSIYSIPSYANLDFRFAWRPTAALEVAVGSQNLAGPQREFVPSFTSTQFAEAARSVYGKFTWKF